MNIESLLRESRAETLLEPLAFSTETGKTQFKRQVRLVSPNVGILRRRQKTILSLRKTLDSEKEKQLESFFEEIKDIEPELQTFFEKTDVEKNSYEQLLFSGWKPLEILNTIPFSLLLLAFFKQYIVPALAVSTPIFMFVMPYIFLTYWYRLPITVEQYTHILLGMFGLQNIDLKNPRTIFQGGITLFSIGQSIYQPIQNARHLQTIHVEMMRKAKAAQRLVYLTQDIIGSFPQEIQCKNPLADIEYNDIHRLFANFWDHPYELRLALQCIGDCEVVYRLAKAKHLSPVQFLQGTKPSLQIAEGIDPFLPTSIPFSLRLSGTQHHAILTGPNRGGKSSVLRSTLLSVVMAQTFGMGFYTSEGSFKLRPFDWIATGLRLEDRPGTTSMFESEVEFAIQILRRARQEPEKIGFVLFDELFHSTNPPDGARTADIFLQKLWKTRNTATFISTHVFDLAKKAEKRIQRLCVPAHLKEDGSLHFTYTLKKGICTVSSVDEILKEKGLLE